MKIHKKPCPRCGERTRRPGQAYCAPCHAEYMRGWRVGRELSPEEIRKGNCRSYTNVLVKRGHLVKGSCYHCGTTRRVQAHHPDYARPRLVVWMCGFHHRAFHRWMDSLRWLPGPSLQLQGGR